MTEFDDEAPPRGRSRRPVSDADQDLLREIALLTGNIRGLETHICETADKRRKVMIQLREHRITYREMALAMNVTEQSVYKILRDHIEPTPRRRGHETGVSGIGSSEAAGQQESVPVEVGQDRDAGDGWRAAPAMAFAAD